MGNRSFHSDDWPAWLEEFERLRGAPVIMLREIDTLYGEYLSDVMPEQAAERRYGANLQHVAVPVRTALERVEDAYYGRLEARLSLWAIAGAAVAGGIGAGLLVWLVRLVAGL